MCCSAWRSSSTPSSCRGRSQHCRCLSLIDCSARVRIRAQFHVLGDTYAPLPDDEPKCMHAVTCSVCDRRRCLDQRQRQVFRQHADIQRGAHLRGTSHTEISNDMAPCCNCLYLRRRLCVWGRARAWCSRCTCRWTTPTMLSWPGAASPSPPHRRDACSALNSLDSMTVHPCGRRHSRWHQGKQKLAVYYPPVRPGSSDEDLRPISGAKLFLKLSLGPAAALPVVR